MSRSYEYRAARADGGLVRGTVEASTGTQAVALLVDRGLQPVDLTDASPGESRHPASRRDLAVVFRSVSALVAAGVPLERAVASSEALAGGPLRACLAAARNRLREGTTLSQALDSERGTVPDLVLGMVRAGERAGRLPATLEQVATHLELEAELVSRIRHALAYPMLLLVAGLASVAVIGTVVVPKFAALLDQSGQELPAATRLLLAGSTLLSRHWLLLLVSCAALAWLGSAWLGQHRAWWHRHLLSVPGVGRIRHGLATVRVSRALSGALDSGMPLLSALDAAAAAAEDREIGARLVSTANGMLAGQDENAYNSNGGKFAGAARDAHSFDASRYESVNAPGYSYFRNRVYDQHTGRWTQEDPIGIAGGLNLYQFNGNNPVQYADPFGLCAQKQRGNLTQAEGVSECEKFARYTENLAAASKAAGQHRGQFVRSLGERVAGFPNGIATLRPGRSQVNFGESGFNERFVDGDGHPARHFAANLVLGFQTSGSISAAAAILREIPGLGAVGGCDGGACSLEDVRLGTQGARAGQQLWEGSLEPADLGNWIRENL